MSYSNRTVRRRAIPNVHNAFCICIALVAACPSKSTAAPLRIGDILISAAGDNDHTPSVLRVDPVSGDRSFVTGGGVGTGIELLSVAGLSLEGNSTLFITDMGHEAVLRVDLATGDREIVSGLGVGAGIDFDRPEALCRESETTMLVLDRNRFDGRILRVDLTTGDRTIVTSSTHGAGPDIINPGQLIALPGGDILMTVAGLPDDGITGAVYRVDPVTGNRSVFSGPTRGAGTDFITASGITLTPSGEILVTDNWNARVYRVDADTGDRHLVVDGLLSSPEFISPYAIAAELSSNVVLTDVNYGEVYRGNPVTGTHVLLSGAATGYGEGPEFGYALGIAVIHVPEPSAIVLVGVGVAVASLYTLRRSAPGATQRRPLAGWFWRRN